ncbi:MAG: ABC transporter substrate-binding protein [Micropruina sp.]|uniref:ABC transporter substrate-binding protein n=1 Tax=Micropruina sp. TaxID=2737536 RepID=UPI0039E32224
MHRRNFLAAALALGLVGCTTTPTGTSVSTNSASATSTGAAAARATIGLSYIPNVQFAPFYVAEAQKLFAGVDAQVSLRHHGSSEGLFTAFTSGNEDFLVAAGSEAMQARAEGVDVIAVGAYYKAFPVNVIVLGSSPIRQLADLKGRSLGVPGRFGESWLAVQVALATAGLTEKDVDIQEVGYTQVAALKKENVDAIVGFSTNELLQVMAFGDEPRALAVAPGTVPLVSTCLLTSKAYAEKHPEVVRQVVAATAKAIEATAADQQAAIDVSATQIPGWTASARPNAEAVLAATVDLMALSDGRFQPALDAAQWDAMAAFLDRSKLISHPVAASDAFSNAYAG